MTARRKLVKEIPVTGNSDVNVIEVELYFAKGGINYFNYKNEARGYYVSVCPYKVTHEGGYKSKAYSAFAGVKTLLLEASRFGQKKFETLKVPEGTLNALIEQVLENNGLSVLEEKQAA
ncbi:MULTISPECIES: hypothetical protein [Pseudoalteromonas]|uniref:hypothetical protein n=1 Tax=Pseudoalteromonas TaxID=53246 RepID=UPI001583A87D|nr:MULTISPECIES: hypothetical protein [Pseudoalteromonas]MDI4654227.1 hypothetical protein [Pseudoalteromonas shioyasakiensis]NUJ40181.1 hypothetical protein [Pseudoalteromonas sp. 0303]